MCWSSASCRCHTEDFVLDCDPDEIGIGENLDELDAPIVDAIIDEPRRTSVSREVTRGERFWSWVGSRAYFLAERISDREWRALGVPVPESEFGTSYRTWRRFFSRQPLYPF